MLKIKYKIPEKNIIKVRSTQKKNPHPIGSTFVSKIPININGIAKIANFFQILNTRSAKNITNNNDAEINRGIATKTETNSLKKNVLQE